MSYQCHGQPRPTAATTILAQDGWDYDQAGPGGVPTRTPRIVEVRPFDGPNPMTTACGYDASHRDPVCVGCEHIIKATP